MNKNKSLRDCLKNREWWHVRKYYKSGHGALIVGENGVANDDDYLFLNITKHPPNGYSYLETEKPINFGESKSYIRLYIQRGNKKRFSKWKMKYEFSKADLDRVEEFLNRKK